MILSLFVYFCINLLFSPEGAKIICWGSAGEANCGNMPKSGMVLFDRYNNVLWSHAILLPLIRALVSNA